MSYQKLGCVPKAADRRSDISAEMPARQSSERRVDQYMPLAYSFSMQTVVETPMYLSAAEAIYS